MGILEALSQLASAVSSASDGYIGSDCITQASKPGFVLSEGDPEPYATIKQRALLLHQRLSAEPRARQSNSVVYRDFRVGGLVTWAGYVATSLHEAVLAAANAASQEGGMFHDMALAAALRDTSSVRLRLEQEFQLALLADPVKDFHALALNLIEESSELAAFIRSDGGSWWPDLQQQVPEHLRKPVHELRNIQSQRDTARYELAQAEHQDTWYGNHAVSMSVARTGDPDALEALRESFRAELRERVQRLVEAVAKAKEEVKKTEPEREKVERDIKEQWLREHRGNHKALLTRYRRRFEQFRTQLAGLFVSDPAPLGPLARATASACHVALKFAEHVAASKFREIGDLDVDELCSRVEREVGWLARNATSDLDKHLPQVEAAPFETPPPPDGAAAPDPELSMTAQPSTQGADSQDPTASPPPPHLATWWDLAPKHKAAISWLITQPRGEAFTRAQILTNATHLHLKGEDRKVLRELTNLGILKSPPGTRDLRLERLPEDLPEALDRHSSWQR